MYFKESLSTNHLIEEFMLLANKTVAKHIGFPTKNAKTFVYRIHDKPDSDRISTLNNIIKKLGYSINNESSDKLSHSLNELLENVKGKGEQQMIETLTIRSMAKAIYTTNNIGTGVWQPICIVDGFICKKEAMRCEWKLKRARGYMNRVKNVNNILCNDTKFTSKGSNIDTLNLKVYVNKDFKEYFSIKTNELEWF